MSNILSSREKKIIIAILNSPHGITLQEISKEVGVSRRTILREMNSVYSWFDKRGFPVERHASKGISLQITEQDEISLKRELSEEQIVHIYNKKERTLYIITELLMSKETLKLSYFSKVLDVSEASISSDLNHVEEYLQKFNLSLERKQGYGVEVLGRERDKRRALVDIIYEMLDGKQLRDAVQKQIGMGEKNVKITNRIRISLLNMIDYETITVIEKAIRLSEKEMGYKLSESSYIALAVHLALACKRIMKNEMIEMRPVILEELKINDEYLVANNLITFLRKELNLVIPDDEIGYVTLHLKGARYKSGLFDSNIIKFNETVISNYELTSVINKIIKYASEKTGYNLKQVDSLLVGLVDHLRPAIARVQLSLDIRNPLLDKIKTDYKEIFEVSKEASKEITKQFGIELPESEIGYIAIHIGSAIEQIKYSKDTSHYTYNVVVTCISGIGTSKMLAERLKKEFSNVKIVEVFSTTYVKDDWLINNEIDLILTTVYFDNEIVPVLMVNPLLPPKDVKKVEQKLNSLAILNKKEQKIEDDNFYDRLNIVKEHSDAILEVLNNLHIYSNMKCTTFDDILSEIVGSITSHTDELRQDLLRREEIGQIVFDDDKVAFLHARSNTVKELHVGIYRNKTVIKNNDHEFDTVLVLVAPEEVSKAKLDVMGEISSRVVSEENFLNDLRYQTQDGLAQKMQSILKKYYNKKLKG
jgi:mannitol operon transcriptional antiterminator